MRLAQVFSLASAGIGFTTASPLSSIAKRSPEPELVDGKYIVNRQTEFANHAFWTFEGGSLPSGLWPSNYPVGSTHTYTPSNVIIRDGYLDLLVPGGQTSQPYSCGEVVTEVTNIKYASVRTVAILTEPAGVCNGEYISLLTI